MREVGVVGLGDLEGEGKMDIAGITVGTIRIVNLGLGELGKEIIMGGSTLAGREVLVGRKDRNSYIE